ncbi:hypothetical protein WISP_120423 [Willisornis vidua]|uniref:Uncharacterized protein n=1 Tax=Willisornis vidua TaxID=1566151 RepID=A0ABQ9CSZ3_9PASS|nr:hypothetical protein WISP_120423 [Willisornis vidua]
MNCHNSTSKEMFRCAFCNHAYPAWASLATSTLAASVGSALPKSSFAKPSHDEDDDDDDEDEDDDIQY